MWLMGHTCCQTLVLDLASGHDKNVLAIEFLRTLRTLRADPVVHRGLSRRLDAVSGLGFHQTVFPHDDTQHALMMMSPLHPLTND